MVRTGHKGKALVGNLLRLYTGGTAGNCPRVRGPADASKNGLLRHRQSLGVITVKRRIDLVGGIAHIGTPFPFRAVHIGIPHTDGNCVKALLPQLIQVSVGRLE